MSTPQPSVRPPVFAALLLVTGTTALSTDTYISALPEVQSTLQTSSSAAQLTMTSFIVGLAVGQLVSGPVSDARGRRRLIVMSCVVFTLMAALCAIAADSFVLIAERLAQGAAAGTAAAVGRAMVNDVWSGREAAAKFGTLSAVGLIAPVAGPAIGGVLLVVGDWRTVFWFLTVVGVFMVVAAVAGLPETLPKGQRHPGGLANLVRLTTDLLRDRHVVVPVAVQCLATAGFFVYIGGSSFVLQEDVGIGPRVYTIVFASNAVAMVCTSALFRILVGRCGAVVLRRYALVTQSAGAFALLAVVLLAPNYRPHLAPVWTCLAVMTAGLGMFFPASSSLVQHAGRRAAGTASALGGGLPFLSGALTTPLTGILHSQTVLTMASCMAVFFAAACLVFAAGRRSTLDPDLEVQKKSAREGERLSFDKQTRE